ncbi:MAG: glycosyltransferase family 1 protein [bacterium]|nr:glycosyltransferase family 1 protein [bacterium]
MSKLMTIDMRMLQASGIGTYISNLVPRLIKNCGNICFCLLGNYSQLRELIGAESERVIFRESVAPIYTVREQLSLVRAIPSETALFWSPHFNIPLSYRGKLMVTVHDLFHLAMPEFVNGFGKQAYAKTLFGRIRKRASMVLFDSEFTQSEFGRLLGPPHKESAVLYCGVDPIWFEAPRGTLGNETPYLLYAGNMKPHKNIWRVLNVVLDDKRFSQYNFVILGKSEGFIGGDTKTKALAEDHPDRIQFAGYVSYDRLRAYYANAACLVFPSLYEGFGLPPLEAMAAGTPALVSDRASIPEICGDAALYCDPESEPDIADKLDRILNDQKLREELIGKGKERAGLYSWDRSAEQLGEIVRSLLN